jgi:hypothetical protein
VTRFIVWPAQTDWEGKDEATVSSQLITPVLILPGYGEHALDKVREQQTYRLTDPTLMKGTDAKVSAKTLGQVRDYAIHPEIRAALMVTDSAGFRVFDAFARSGPRL